MREARSLRLPRLDHRTVGQLPHRIGLAQRAQIPIAKPGDQQTETDDSGLLVGAAQLASERGAHRADQ
jgi:hypothetical protein